ncbi:Uncharacterized protein HZ326_11674 [Fusarium oxysporum f. sp. albedinis]|nr:Uncharacterized protein HZ326_11674 [Fusarium oxysporum f. sp. albedinis]
MRSSNGPAMLVVEQEILFMPKVQNECPSSSFWNRCYNVKATLSMPNLSATSSFIYFTSIELQLKRLELEVYERLSHSHSRSQDELTGINI